MSQTIGKLAKQSGVTIETIRYYQRLGLLNKPAKPNSGYRHYPIESIARIQFIKRAQQSGFTLKEIKELLSLDNSHCKDVRHMAEEKRLQVSQQIKDLTDLHHVLDILVKGCQTDPSNKHCSIIDSFYKRPDSKS